MSELSTSDVNNVADLLSAASVYDKDSELSFEGQGLKLDDEKSAKEVADAIRSCKNLKSLQMLGNTLGVGACKAIGKALEVHPEFQHAKWSDIFTGRLKSEIPDALRYLGRGIIVAKASLVELDLSDNAFGPNGMTGLADFLVSESCYKLRELRLNNNGLGVTGGKMLAKCLMECHKASSLAGCPLALRVFVSGRGRLENEGSIALSEVFKAMGSLEEVSMPQNGINHVGITALSAALAQNKNLAVLNLNDNTFTEKGAAAMAKALPSMQKLQEINFGDCLLRTRGARDIARALRGSHPKLRKLILSFNEIRRDGGVTAVEAIEDKEHFERLDLDGNQFGEDGCELIQSNMEAMHRLDQLGPLDDDEGVDSDEEEEEEVEEEEEEAPVENVPVTPAKPVSAADFLAFPSPKKLQNLGGGDPGSAIVSCLGEDIADMGTAMKTFVKISSVITTGDEKSKAAACQCADAIFKKVFENRENENIEGTLANELMVHLGLIKSEERLSPPTCITGPLIVLEHVVRQPYFPRSTRHILQSFLSRPHPLLEASSSSRHVLMQTLFTF